MLPPPPDDIPTLRNVGLPPLLGETEPPEFEHKNLAAEPSSASIPSCRPPTGQGPREVRLEPTATLAQPVLGSTEGMEANERAGEVGGGARDSDEDPSDSVDGVRECSHTIRRFRQASSCKDDQERQYLQAESEASPPALVRRHPRCRKQWG